MEKEIGHQHGKEKLKEVMDWVLELGIPYLTVYALSTENVTDRATDELNSLYKLYIAGFDEIRADPKIHARQVKVQAVGRIELLPDEVQAAIKRAESDTADYDKW
jgi:undecaprenyl diphosphate synthase